MLKIPPKLNRKIGQAMHDYNMFEDGDRVLIAVSGGVDSLVLLSLLRIWQTKIPITLEITPLHIDHGFWRKSETASPPDKTIGEQVERLGMQLRIEKEWPIKEQERSCYLCARNRRNQLFEYARDQKYTKIALGHHKDDLIETFLLNIVYSGNISTMVPKQQLFKNTLSIVRPMAYLDKDEVISLADHWNLSPVKNLCHLSDETKREKVRDILEKIYVEEPGAKRSIFAALSNVRQEYLL